MKIIEGACSAATRNISLTNFGPSPRYFWISSDPTILRKVALVSAATAFARSVLPVSNSNELPGRLGMRHRAAVGITEESDAVAIIVSEETGEISYVKDSELFHKRTAQQLEQFLNKIFIE